MLQIGSFAGCYYSNAAIEENRIDGNYYVIAESVSNLNRENFPYISNNLHATLTGNRENNSPYKKGSTVLPTAKKLIGINHDNRFILAVKNIEFPLALSKDEVLKKVETDIAHQYREALSRAVLQQAKTIHMRMIGCTPQNKQQANQYGLNLPLLSARKFLEIAQEFIKEGKLENCILFAPR